MQCSVIIFAVHFKECPCFQILGEPARFSGSQKSDHRTPRTYRPASLEQMMSSANGARRGNELPAFIQNSSAMLQEYDFTALAYEANSSIELVY